MPSHSTEELRAWAAEIERIRDSSSSDARAQIEQIMSVAKQAIRELSGQSLRIQHDFQETAGASNTTNRGVMAAGYSGILDSPSTPSLDPSLEDYMDLSTDFLDDSQFSEVPASILGGQDDSAPHPLDPSYGMDTDFLGIGGFQY